MAVRVISFDVGETLLRPYPGFGQVVVDCCRVEGDAIADGREAVLESYADISFSELRRRGEGFSLSVDQSKRVWTNIYRGFLIGENIRPDRADELTELIYARFLDHATYRPFDDAIPVLSALRERGFVIGVTSNWESWLAGLLVTTGMSAYLDFQIISGDVGVEKPDRRIFEATIEAAKADPSSILHVGDSLGSDVVGARAAGLDAVLLDRFNRYPRAEHRRIASLDELLAFPELIRPVQ